MGKQSTRENKTIYQLCREEQELTREKASENMTGVSASRMKKSSTSFRSQLLMIFCRWLNVIRSRSFVITTAHTNVQLAAVIYQR